MKKILLSVVLATTLALTSCQFDDSALWSKLDEYGQSIKDHEQRISALEELCKQMNTNIEALQTLVDALEKRDYVTNVSEVRSNGEVIGYTISFAYSDTITIYHGQDGKDGANGADGKDGYTPQIGGMKDTDGIYYWTLDGEWLLDAKGNKIKAVGTDGADGKDGQDGANGTDGKDGQDGTNGSDGKDGQDGTDGKDGADGQNGKDGADGQNGKDGADGVTPQLKIENDYWYVSYDNGATWVQLGKATGEDGKDGQNGNDGADGSDGADGEDGDSIFNSVTQDDEYVYFNLSDGTMITLPKHDKENIQFEDFNVKRLCVQLWDTNGDFELSYSEAAAVTAIGTNFQGGDYYFFDELQYFTGISEIEEDAFNNAAIMKITIPCGVRSIGNNAFYNCRSLKRIDLSLCENLNIIGTCAFQNTAIQNLYIPNDIRQINNKAFYNCTNLRQLVFEDNSQLIYIGESAFEGAEINSLIIPASVETIDVAAFYDCPIETILFESNSKLTIIKGATKYDTNPNDNYISWSYANLGKGAFANNKMLKTITIPKSVIEIGASTFENCSNLQSVYFENGSNLTSLAGFGRMSTGSCSTTSCRGYGVFSNCTSLKSIIIPAGVAKLEIGTFLNCTNLTHVEFESGSTLSSIGGDKCSTVGCNQTHGVFNGCKSLTSIKLGGTTPPSCSSYSFYSITPSNIKLKVPAGSISGYQGSNSWKSFKIEEYY